jgi:hypothetical protein
MLINRKETSRRRGVVLVLVAACLLTLLLFACLAVDVGYICALTAEQQNNADASALSGASGLQDEDWREAFNRSINTLELNQIPQGFSSLHDQIIEFGWWNPADNTFNLAEDLEDAFAIRVRAARNDTQLFFAGLAGIMETDVWREAVSIGSKPCGGIWGLEGITAGSISTDSFDSTVESYDQATAGHKGNLCSARGITVEGSFEVDGAVMTGFGYPLVVNGVAGQITGLTTSSIRDVEAPPAEFGDVANTNNNGAITLTDGGTSPWMHDGWDLKVTSDNLTLPGGTYYFDSISLSGGATITLAGPVVLYVAGEINATGGALLNMTQNPSDLTIISSGESVKLAGGVDFHGSILAPYAEVKLTGNAHYYGALVARYIKLGGDFSAHVDESLPLSRAWLTPPAPTLVK